MRQREPVANRFRQKTAIVTGGASGIGRATVEELCKEGAWVAFTDISERGCDAWRDLEGAGYGTLFLHGDMADESFCQACVQATLARWGRVDYLVNNAFSFISKGADASPADWERALRVGPIAYANMARLAVPAMARQGGGAIVNVSSISAFVAQPNRWTYNAAKGAVNTLTKCMALDFASQGIRVNSVSPGWIWTSEVDKAAHGDRARWEPVWGQFHILERCGEPVECAAAILFLLSDDAAFITGADLAVDGGYLALGPEGLGRSSTFAGSQ